jgi:hypothetical protein
MILSPETQIYCDMDGVLVDFEATAIALLNSMLNDEKLSIIPKRKAFFFLRGQVQRKLGADWRASSTADLQISEVRSFMFELVGSNPGAIFASMQPFPDAIKVLWPFLTSSEFTVNILSAPINARTHAPQGSSAEAGKRAWLSNPSNGISPAPAKIIISPSRDKPNYAVTNDVPNILIDDKASTVDAWNNVTDAAGFGRGYGVLHIPGNSSGTIAKLRKAGLK